MGCRWSRYRGFASTRKYVCGLVGPRGNRRDRDPQIKLDQQSNKDPAKPTEDDEPVQHGCTGRVLQCFSVYSNTALLLGTQLGADSISAIHGLRFLGMIWVIMAHTLYYGSDFFDNRPLAFFMSEGFMAQVISNAVLSVDSFFFLSARLTSGIVTTVLYVHSGFLLSYLYYKKTTSEQRKGLSAGFKVGLSSVMAMVFRRFMRLTPAYMAVLGLTTLNMAYYVRTEPYRLTERPDLVCPRYWWRNILYVNNLFSRDQMVSLSSDCSYKPFHTLRLFSSATFDNKIRPSNFSF
ncbi:hypothetical protein PR048_003849 [Dryococelus australis]|uniref:Acyltransferase 3 domain-containing protein n=1 Tax=Dryococelus australis TaxID=614101 RepID=A0ABQ9IPA4_9NEOP|nr:hypothetical protein PR048_003849 [Dryococelus australis]